nr:putative LPS assembly protein LptD [Prolixibacteraceae bacterium]
MTRRHYIVVLFLLVLFHPSAFPQEEFSISDSIQNFSPLPDSILNFFQAPDSTRIPVADPSLESSPSDSLLSAPEKQKAFIDSPINYNAKDSMAVSLENGEQIVYLYGDASIQYGSIELTADFVSVNFNTREIFARGIPDSSGTIIEKPHFKDGTEEFDCTSLRYNFETGKGFVENVVTEQQDGKVRSAKAKMISKDVFCMADGKYSTCDAEHPHFYLNINKGKIIGKKAIIAGFSYIVLEDFPLYFPFLPYGYIPTFNKSYSSGIIIPQYGEDTKWGFYLKEGGFYWAASDYFDVRITGDIYSKGTWGLNIGSNYRLRYKFSGNFGFNIVNNVTGEKGINQKVQQNFSVRWTHSQDPKANPSFKFSANVNFSTSGYDKLNEY